MNEPVSVLTFGGGAPYWQSVVASASAGVTVKCCENRQQLAESYPGVEVLVSFEFPDKLLERLPDLKWLQCLSVGVDALIGNQRIPQDVVITNTSGLYGDAVAEYAIWAMITLFRRFHEVIRNQRKRRWEQKFGESLDGKRIGIVGLGDVGTHVARLATAHGMKITGYIRDEAKATIPEFVDTVIASRRLPDTVSNIDALILCIPLTDATRGIIDPYVIENMRSSSIVINTSRAGLVAGNAVIDAVASGTIAGAALDVFEKEPLPRWNKTWNIPNLLVTPHTSSMTSKYKTRIADLVTENVIRYTMGEPLRNLVDRSKGY